MAFTHCDPCRRKMTDIQDRDKDKLNCFAIFIMMQEQKRIICVAYCIMRLGGLSAAMIAKVQKCKMQQMAEEKAGNWTEAFQERSTKQSTKLDTNRIRQWHT